jgi:hypothetical protein
MHPSAPGHDIRQTTGYSRYTRHRLQLPDDHYTVYMVGNASERSHAIQVEAGQTDTHAYSEATLNKLRWLAFNTLGPEWPFMKALNSWINAKKLERKFDVYKRDDDVTWTRSHTQLANMGGFVVIFGPGARKPAGQVDVEQLAHPAACIGGTCKCTDLSDPRHIHHTDVCARWRPFKAAAVLCSSTSDS